ncbi:FAD-binding protein [Nocardioides mangrovicus]|uniref:L-aspartate oxidase n=2 Tax=Nocardioides mangrovicus TaxID=2478913 RepID=A0A3L8P8K2_9ACTN|nr:FAD-binding protein [Nocardioides mangrovicus]
MSAALGLAATRDVLVLEDADGSTRWAQGGIAAAFGSDPAEEHAVDTQVAGAGLCDPDAVRRLTEEGPLRVAELVGRGARLDREADGSLQRSREGGHGRRRVVHTDGDATGAEVWRTLHAAGSSLHRRRARVVGLSLTAGQVTGVVTADGEHIAARAVVLATGGLGHVYGATTNPEGVRGDGLALALAAGAATSHLEFVQFHPTALATGGSGQLPLVTEALRGDGAVLRDRAGTAFMQGRHPLADLAPRDVVAAAVHEAGGGEHVWLDCRGVAEVRRHFPTVTAACEAIGVDPARDLVPVRAAQHFLCGGVTTDRWGATSLPGLYAVGEVADSGVHGANRLASNSLLEGLVYGARVAAGLTLELPSLPAGASRDVLVARDPVLAARASALMDAHAGIVRDAEGLGRAADWLAPRIELDATCRVAAAVVAAALARRESVGCHRRSDVAALVA